MTKTLLIFFVSLSISFTVKAQYVNIPDDYYRNFLQKNFPTCFNEQGLLDTTCTKIVQEDSLIIDLFLGKVLAPWDLHYFKTLKYLSYTNDEATEFPVLPASLTTLICGRNNKLIELPSLPPSLITLVFSYNDELKQLPTLPTSLVNLDCSNNWKLAQLPALPLSLKTLNCEKNQLLQLPILPPSLTTLNCSDNFNSLSSTFTLTQLPDLPPTLITLDCHYSPLLQLPASLPPSLMNLYCSQSQLTQLPSLPPSLVTLDCQYNQIVQLHTLPTSLVNLNCSGNLLTQLPTLPASLLTLDCSQNQLTQLPTLPASLINLNGAYNILTKLPTLPASLINLNCNKNILTELPELPASLKDLRCYNNKLIALPFLHDSLQLLYCAANQLTQLPALPNSLLYINCNDNYITNLNQLPTKLLMLCCIKNKLTSLPDLPDSLLQLHCIFNNITCLPLLPTTLFLFPNIFNDLYDMGINLPYSNITNASIFIDADKIKCIPNNIGGMIQTTYLYEGQDTATACCADIVNIPLCSPTNNIYHCQSFPVISGRVFYDNNSNGVKDIGELYKSNIKISLSNSHFTYTNNTGYFELGADTGNYSINVSSPEFYKAAPASFDHYFTTLDTLVSHTIPLQPTIVIDSLNIYITPLNRAARPGFSYPYQVSYENIGTTTLSPNIIFSYDNTKLIYDSSSIGSVNNSGNSLILNQTGIVPGEHRSFTTYFTIKPTATLGDTLYANVLIKAGTANTSSTTAIDIGGSFDPNDKQATPELSPQQVADGKYITYTIRCQNTGTDTAFNIVIADTLSNLLQASTLEMLNSSHNCNVSVNGNIVYFEFFNILLPDSNRNEVGSHGFVTFRIKPVSSVTNGTIINNKAAIYFDYNAPVITNVATTHIKVPDVIIPVRLIAFTAMDQPGNTTNLYWNTTNEINSKYFVIEQSTDGIHYTAIATVVAKGAGSNSYIKNITKPVAEIIFYRLKMIDVDGNYSYSSIIKIKTEQLADGITILTNPVKDVISIKVVGESFNNTFARVIDAHAVVIKSLALKQGVQTIDVSKLSSGIYYLQTSKGSKRIVIQK